MKKVLFLLLAVVNLIHCQEQVSLTLQEVLEKLEGINDKLRGYEELLHKIPDMQRKLLHLEDNIQELRREVGQCVREDELEHLSNVSAAAHQEIYSFVHDEISGVKSLAERDECLEGSQLCGSLGICQNTVFSFTCSCSFWFRLGWFGLC
ncbi:uncharacterized protein [Palaemon carinicauda]|uniref:uncharacterized protein n=1 Tax=Palaemon carinicauda TaxID=392227 RepID=UPI0035B59E56